MVGKGVDGGVGRLGWGCGIKDGRIVRGMQREDSRARDKKEVEREREKKKEEWWGREKEGDKGISVQSDYLW